MLKKSAFLLRHPSVSYSKCYVSKYNTVVYHRQEVLTILRDRYTKYSYCDKI